MLEAMAASRHAIGSTRFIHQTERRLAGRRSGRLQDRDVALPRTTLDIARIDEAVAAHYGLPVEELQTHGHRAGAAKFVSVELACRLTGLTHRAIGSH